MRRRSVIALTVTALLSGCVGYWVARAEVMGQVPSECEVLAGIRASFHWEGVAPPEGVSQPPGADLIPVMGPWLLHRRAQHVQVRGWDVWVQEGGQVPDGAVELAHNSTAIPGRLAVRVRIVAQPRRVGARLGRWWAGL